jgi:hypothetical protein
MDTSTDRSPGLFQGARNLLDGTPVTVVPGSFVEQAPGSSRGHSAEAVHRALESLVRRSPEVHRKLSSGARPELA